MQAGCKPSFSWGWLCRGMPGQKVQDVGLDIADDSWMGRGQLPCHRLSRVQTAASLPVWARLADTDSVLCSNGELQQALQCPACSPCSLVGVLSCSRSSFPLGQKPGLCAGVAPHYSWTGKEDRRERRSQRRKIKGEEKRMVGEAKQEAQQAAPLPPSPASTSLTVVLPGLGLSAGRQRSSNPEGDYGRALKKNQGAALGASSSCSGAL